MNRINSRRCWKRLNQILATATLSLTSTVPAWAWSDHVSLVWPLLRSEPELFNQTVIVEPLEQFLRSEQQGITRTLAAVESWSVATIEHYPPTPSALRWGNDATPTSARFFAAIRVNPNLPYRLYVVPTPERPSLGHAPLLWSDLSFLRGGASQLAARYWAVEVGEGVSIAEVVSSASDEPDFGMDIGLFEDNGTHFGQRYGFGNQPFGNPNLDYSSQAPFHMGFYHLDWLTRTAQPYLLRTYPLWRLALFGELADLAFRTGHDYWGWRFLGWGLHYIGDLTQPYHAIPLPGVGMVDALWSVVQGKTGQLVQLVSNRHGVIESYQYQRLIKALEGKEWSAPLLKAISYHAESAPVEYESFVMALTAESVLVAAAFDAVIETNVPSLFVSDPGFEWVGSGFEKDIVQIIFDEMGDKAIADLDAVVALQLVRFSKLASRWISRGNLSVGSPKVDGSGDG